MNSVLTALLTMLFPGIPAWLATFLSSVIPASIDVVREFASQEETGEVKRKAAVAALAEFLDEEFDEIPQWRQIGEERRDRILTGLVELSYFVIEQGPANGRNIRISLRKARRKLRRS